LFLELNSDEINSRIPVVTNLNVIWSAAATTPVFNLIFTDGLHIT
jgi:hypothetical protein